MDDETIESSSSREVIKEKLYRGWSIKTKINEAINYF